ENVVVLLKLVAAALASRRRLARDDQLTALRAMPRRNAMSPPQLARDTPVMNVAHPLEVRLGVILGNELDLASLHNFDRAIGQRLNLHEPLRREPRLHDR